MILPAYNLFVFSFRQQVGTSRWSPTAVAGSSHVVKCKRTKVPILHAAQVVDVAVEDEQETPEGAPARKEI